jgi:DNA-binding transcriptional LysR family regulator
VVQFVRPWPVLLYVALDCAKTPQEAVSKAEAARQPQVCSTGATEVQKLPEFDWNDLRYFVAVAREGSTVAAAKTLGVSQPTVQRRLAALEQKIGCQLVEHLPTGYRLTELGKGLLPHAERVEQEALAFARQLTTRDEALAGTLRITCPEADLPRLLAAVFDRFKAKYPRVRLEFLVTDKALDLSKGEADIALRGGPLKNSTLIGRKLADALWLVYASSAYLERHGAPERVEDFDAHSIVIYAGPVAELGPGKWLKSRAASAKIGAYSNSVSGALAAARSGLGLAMLPAHVGNAERELLCVWRPQPQVTEPVTALVHPDLRNLPRLRAMLDFLGEEAATIRALFLGDAGEHV